MHGKASELQRRMQRHSITSVLHFLVRYLAARLQFRLILEPAHLVFLFLGHLVGQNAKISRMPRLSNCGGNNSYHAMRGFNSEQNKQDFHIW
jgi:hypothetical protein